MRENAARFAGRKHNRQLRRAGDALDVVNEIEFSLEHLLVKKQQRAEGLILSRGSDMFFDSEMRKEFADLFLAHVARMAFAMKENVPSNPLRVRLLGADRIMLHLQMPADAVE